MTVDFSNKLMEEGIFIPAIRFPTVKKGEARLRLTLMATHDYEDLNFALNKIEKIKYELKI